MISDERLNEILGALCTDSLHDYEQVFDGIKHGEIGDMAKELLALRNVPVSQPCKLPDGWKLVPIIPTYEMMEAWENAGLELGEEWRAMVDAAPLPPTDSTT